MRKNSEKTRKKNYKMHLEKENLYKMYEKTLTYRIKHEKDSGKKRQKCQTTYEKV